MSCILYYSNFCQHSKKLLGHVSKVSGGKDIHFICIDKREVNNGKTFIVLNDGSKIIMPENVSKVPALLLLNNNYKVLYGDSIYEYIQSITPKTNSNVSNSSNGSVSQPNAMKSEPSCFSFSNSGFICSDNYSFLELDSDALGTKGNGGMSQMHSYVALNEQNTIPTPSDEFEYKTERQGEMTMEAYQKQREMDFSNIKYKES